MRKLLLSAFFLAIRFGLAASPLGAAMPADLKLRDSVDTRVLVSPKPNPHAALACSECHLKVPSHRPASVEYAGEFLRDDYPDELCLRCHQGDCRLHPCFVDPAAPGSLVNVPGFLPLRFLHEGKVKVVCLTCHDIHYPHTGFRLLRGYALNPSVQPSRFHDRLEFCGACHGSSPEGLSPHDPPDRSEGCGLCHPRRPEGKERPALTAPVNDLCTYCHPVYLEPHYLRFNPFPELEPAAIASSGLLSEAGAFSCLSCHLPHGGSHGTCRLRPQFVELARTSRRVNPHQRGAFCLSCHKDGPFGPGTSTELVTTDVAALCGRCHQSGAITGMYHPLARQPTGKGRADLPLTPEGALTCTTCHLAGHGAIIPGNPRFLRGGPYVSLEVFCQKCHDFSGLADRTPHPETARGEGCELCHLPGNKYSSAGLAVGDPRADGNLLCLRCHESFPHPAGAAHTLRPGNYDYASVDPVLFPLDRYGRLTCYSCHQIHRPSEGSSYLRLAGAPSATAVCCNCHPY